MRELTAAEAALLFRCEKQRLQHARLQMRELALISSNKLIDRVAIDQDETSAGRARLARVLRQKVLNLKALSKERPYLEFVERLLAHTRRKAKESVFGGIHVG